MLDSSKLKEFADDNFKFDENGGKFSKMGRKHWEKEKLLITSNFSLSYSVFKRLVLQTRKNQGLFGKGSKNTNLKLLVMTIYCKQSYLWTTWMASIDIYIISTGQMCAI